MGSVHLRLGRHQDAIDHHRQALDLARQTGIRYPETEALLGWADACQRAGLPGQAMARATQALALAGRSDYRVLEGRAHTSLAAAQLAHGHHGKAAEHARRALALHRASGHRLGQARALVVLGHALRQPRRRDAGAAAWREALRLLTDIGAPDGEDVRALLRQPVPPT
jgi:tetratricopeptide (TPR) repeat protein